MVLKFVQQGEQTVVRDAATGRVVRDGKAIRKALSPAKGESLGTWRKYLLSLTDGGRDLLLRHLNIANGVPHIPRLPDGREAEPQIPSMEVQRQASLSLMRFAFGTEVSQNEVLASEIQAEQMQSFQAMSDADLRKIVDGEFTELPADTKEEND